MKQLLLLCNLASFVVLLVVSFVFLCVPSLLGRIGLDLDSARVVLLQLISFLLLMGSMQKNLSWGWRRFALAGSFVVLGQSLLIAIMIRGMT